MPKPVEDQIRDQIALDVAINLDNCPDCVCDILGFTGHGEHDVNVKWDFKTRPGVVRVVCGPDTFEIAVSVTKVATPLPTK